MENNEKKSITALLDEKIKEKTSAQTHNETLGKFNAFSADFFKKENAYNNFASSNISSEQKEKTASLKDLLTGFAEPEVDIEKNISVEEKKSQPSVLETPNYDFIETTNSLPDMKQKNKAKKRFRAKLAIITYSIIFLICSCWTISNAIELSNTARNISEISYNINEINYIIKLEQTDNYTNGENSEIANIIEITPPALAEPTQIQPITNWFDRFCAWLSGLFR